ncbi:hypothetical protein LguiB_004343 [Lonicera macranthoides]
MIWLVLFFPFPRVLLPNFLPNIPSYPHVPISHFFIFLFSNYLSLASSFSFSLSLSLSLSLIILISPSQFFIHFLISLKSLKAKGAYKR